MFKSYRDVQVGYRSIVARGKPVDSRSAFTIIELFVVICIIAILFGLLLPARRRAPEAARRMTCSNSIKQIGQALLAYELHYKKFPPAYTVNLKGEPLHSWRTLILPFLEQQDLYDHIQLDQPWNSPANRKARETKVDLYSCPSLLSNRDMQFHTTYHCLVAPNGLLHPTASKSLTNVKDDHGSTLLIVESNTNDACHWMNPQALTHETYFGINAKNHPSHSGGRHACFINGSVKFISAETSKELMNAMITIDGNEDFGTRTDE